MRAETLVSLRSLPLVTLGHLLEAEWTRISMGDRNNGEMLKVAEIRIERILVRHPYDDNLTVEVGGFVVACQYVQRPGDNTGDRQIDRMIEEFREMVRYVMRERMESP